MPSPTIAEMFLLGALSQRQSFRDEGGRQSKSVVGLEEERVGFPFAPIADRID